MFTVVYDPRLNQGSIYDMSNPSEAADFQKSMDWIDENSNYPGWISTEDFETIEAASDWLDDKTGRS